MDKKQIQSILQDALEEKIPSSEVNLWRAVKSNLVAGTTKQQGANMNTIKPRGMSRLAYASLAIIALLTLAFATPQGRAFAQSVIQLFTRAQSESFPVEEPVTQTDASAPTAMPPSPLISVAEAEALAGFDLAELPSVPQGFEYLGARLYGNSVSIEYAVPGRGGNLILMQSKDGFLQSEWDQVPADAIVPVKVGGVDAEYAQGTFVVMAGETSATWNSDAPIFRLRWVKDGVWFELTKYGDVVPIEYLDMDGLIELAESLR
jgi:hypothetical protein